MRRWVWRSASFSILLLVACLPWRGGRFVCLVPAGGPADGSEPAGALATARVEIAADEPSREYGLMNRDSLGKDAGMLFVYADEVERTFWMKNTRIPLSIAFADRRGRIVRILEMAPGVGIPDDDLRLYESGAPAMYALEMNEGWFSRNGVRVGDLLWLDPAIRSVKAR